MSLRSFLLSALAVTVVLTGCSGSRHMSPQTGGIMLDTPQSVSPGSIAPAPMAHTAILPVSVMAVKPQSAIQGLNWTQIPGSATFAAAAPAPGCSLAGSLWVLSTAPGGPDKYIWHYVNGTWTNISGLATRLSVAPDGTLYAINSGGGTYSYNGTSWTALGGGASDITVAADGSLYVLSNGNSAGSDQAIWHNVSGTWSQAPGSGVRLAASWDPNSYTLSNGTISPNGLYVLNAAGSIYYKNPSNSFVQLPGAASAIAPTANGGVFVLGYPADSNGNSIYSFDLSAAGWTQQSGAGVSLSTDSTHLYVIGSSGGIYSSSIKPPGGSMAEYPIPTASAAPNDIVAGPDGNLWFTENNGNKIGKITPCGGTITEYAIPTVSAKASGIAAGPDGNLWFTENNGNKIGKITTSGTITEYAIPTSSAGASHIAAGPDGNLWFTEHGGAKIGKITTSGAFTEYVLPTDCGPLACNQGPYGITAGPDGNLWFTEYGVCPPCATFDIGKITPGGTLTTYRGQGNFAFGIAAGPDSNLWFTSYGSSLIEKISTSGTVTAYATPTSGASPWAVAAGPDGNLWFTENSGNQIGKITTSGTFTEYAIPTAGAGAQGIAPGPDGNLWFTEQISNKIGKITP
jgi:streptogramin lyase